MQPAEQILRIVEATGPVGAIIIAIVLAFGLVAFLWTKGRSLFAAGTREQQATEFQDRLIKALEAVSASENSLRSQLAAALAENAALRDELRELTSSVDLLRGQMRLLIAQMRDIRAGRIAPGDVEIPGDPA